MMKLKPAARAASTLCRLKNSPLGTQKNLLHATRQALFDLGYKNSAFFGVNRFTYS
jgi:hypothetical protein